MELDSRKKRKRDRMMRSNSFDTQEMREIGRKEAGESRGFPILWMGIMEAGESRGFPILWMGMKNSGDGG